MKKNIMIMFTTAFVVLSLTTMAVSQISRKAKDDMYAQIELYTYALTTVQADYVEELEPKDLIYGSLKGMLSTLDPHSQFLDPDEYKELKTETQGKFGGLGIEISIRDNLLTIITPIYDTPAYKAGLEAGDKIVRIDGETTRDITLLDAVKKLRGDPGTSVDLTILREEEKKLLDFTVTRDIIKITSIKESKKIEDDIGYIKLIEFQEGTNKELETALQKLEAEGINSLILDLRNNPGGLLNSAVEVASKFLEEYPKYNKLPSGAELRSFPIHMRRCRERMVLRR